MHERLVGTLILTRYGAEVLTDGKQVSENIAVAPRYMKSATDGDKVVVEIIRPATRKQPPMGKVVDVRDVTPGELKALHQRGHCGRCKGDCNSCDSECGSCNN